MPRVATKRKSEAGEPERFCNGCHEYHPETLDYWYANPTRPGQFNTPCRACQSSKVAQRSRAAKAAAA